ncbi:MAG: virulence RhuM family protein [Victivallales bacterium]|nr:virulence RhuM family protein [Victivallales bacterium]
MSEQTNEIIVYQPDETIRLEVRLHQESIWLTQLEIANLFGVQKAAISKHLKHIFQSGELLEVATVSKMETLQKEGTRQVVRTQDYYNLDVIIAIGYRVNSIRATQFRIWATQVLRNYLLRGYAVNDRLDRLETKVARHDEQIGVILKTALPPMEGVLFEGQICDAYATAMKLIKSARRSLVLIDNYIDETVLTMLGARADGVSATIYTRKCTAKLRLDVQKYNAQYPPIAIKPCRGVHDRFLLIDDEITYHIGASLKDLGKSLFAFSRFEIPPQELLAHLQPITPTNA